MLSSSSRGCGTGLAAGTKNVASAGYCMGTVPSVRWHGGGTAPAAGDECHRHHHSGCSRAGAAVAWGPHGSTPASSHSCYGIPTARAGSCCTAPTCLLWWHEAQWVVGVQGGLLHRGNPLWKCRGREAVVLAGVCVKLEQGLLVGSVPCRETTCGKVLGSPTQAATHSAPREQGWSHLWAPRTGPASQGHGGRCHSAAAAPPESRAVWGQ